MYSIGTISRRSGVKVPTIRYYEQIGLLARPERTEGNQRRYTIEALKRLGLIKNAREFGFSMDDIRVLIDLEEQPHAPCNQASEVAREHLLSVRERMKKLKLLEAELELLASGCSNTESSCCSILQGLASHKPVSAK